MASWGYGELTVELSEQFRKKASECLELARNARSLESHSHWLAMAQFWFNLAVYSEDQKAIESVDPSAIDDAVNARRDKSN